MINFTFVSVLLCCVGVLLCIGDYIIFKKNKALLADLSALKEWCASTGNNPDDYIKMFKKTMKVMRKEVKK